MSDHGSHNTSTGTHGKTLCLLSAVKRERVNTARVIYYFHCLVFRWLQNTILDNIAIYSALGFRKKNLYFITIKGEESRNRNSVRHLGLFKFYFPIDFIGGQCFVETHLMMILNVTKRKCQRVFLFTKNKILKFLKERGIRGSQSEGEHTPCGPGGSEREKERTLEIGSK